MGCHEISENKYLVVGCQKEGKLVKSSERESAGPGLGGCADDDAQMRTQVLPRKIFLVTPFYRAEFYLLLA